VRYSAKTDDNHMDVVKRFREYGCSVLDASRMGKGFPDIIVGYRHVNYLIEIKDGKKPQSKQKLTPDQVVFFDTWKGQVQVINSLEAVDKFMVRVRHETNRETL